MRPASQLMNLMEKPAGSGRCVVAYSGGKDGHLALRAAIRSGLKVESLIHLDGGGSHPVYFHDFGKLPAVRLHARLLGLPLAVLKTPAGFDHRKAGAIAGLLAGYCRGRGIKKVYCGITAEDDNTLALNEAAPAYGLEFATPLVKLDFIGVLQECFRAGIKALITGVEKKKGIKSWLGRPISPELVAYLRRRQKNGDALDGNDFQTCVLKSPLFSGESRPGGFSVRESRDQYFLKIRDYRLK